MVKVIKLPNDGELYEDDDGNKFYYLNNRLPRKRAIYHREDGPAVIHSNGDKFWILNGEYHREDGPAVELANGNKYWYLHNKLHRQDGPAVEEFDGNQWWINGEHFHCRTQKQFEQLLKLKAFW